MKIFNIKWALIILALVLAAVFADVLTHPKKYKIGMSWDEVEALAKPQKLELSAAGLETEGIPKDILQKEVAFSTYDSRAGLFIEFNYEKTILRVQRWKYFGIDFANLAKKLPQHQSGIRR
jgi:hypothetical protein